MTFKGLTLTGPNGRTYVLGDPIEVYDERTLIGKIHSVMIGANGSEVLLENFWTVDFADFRAKALPKLVLAEVVTFIAQRSLAISAVGIELSRAQNRSIDNCRGCIPDDRWSRLADRETRQRRGGATRSSTGTCESGCKAGSPGAR